MAPSVRRSTVLVAALLSSTPMMIATPALAAEGDTVTIFNINDFHGRIASSGADLACTLETQRAQADATGTSFFLSAGDNIGASEFESFVDQDNPTLDYLNALELDASAVGNHEFDQGIDDLTGRVDQRANFEYLGANVYGPDGQRALPAYSIEQRDGVTVAVIGVVTKDTASLVSPAGIQGITFTDPVAEVNKVVEEIKASGANPDIIIAEYHDGGTASADAGTQPSGELLNRIATEASADVDAIFTGHTHKTYAFDPARPVIQTGEYGQNLGAVTFVEQADGSYAVKAQDLTPTEDAAAGADCATFPRFVEAKNIIDAATAQADQLGSQVVGSVASDVTTAWDSTKATYVKDTWTKQVDDKKGDDRSASSAISNIAAESQVWALNRDSYAGKKPDFGVMGPGSMRAELFYGTDGEVTLREANDVMPFGNYVHTVDLTGAQVYQMLEQQWQPEGSSRPYLQLGLSPELTYTFNEAPAAGEPHILEVFLNGEPIDPNKTYTVAGQSFLLEGGDNFSVFTKGTNNTDTGLLDRDTWMDYLGAHENLQPDYSQRAMGIEDLAPGAAGTKDDPMVLRFTRLHSTSLGAPKIKTVSVEIAGQTYTGEYVFDEASGTWGAIVEIWAPEGVESGTYKATVTAEPKTGSSFSFMTEVKMEGDQPTPPAEPQPEAPSDDQQGDDQQGNDQQGEDQQADDQGDAPVAVAAPAANTPAAEAPAADGEPAVTSTEELPRTGAEIAPYALGALALAAAGGALVWARRRARSK